MSDDDFDRQSVPLWNRREHSGIGFPVFRFPGFPIFRFRNDPESVFQNFPELSGMLAEELAI